MVRSILLLLLLATPFVAATPAQGSGGAADEPDQSKKADAVPKDFEPLQGTWQVAKVTMDGKEIRDRGASDSTLTFKGSELVWKAESRGSGSPWRATRRRTEGIQGDPRRAGASAVRLDDLCADGDKLKLAFYDAPEGPP